MYILGLLFMMIFYISIVVFFVVRHRYKKMNLALYKQKRKPIVITMVLSLFIGGALYGTSPEAKKEDAQEAKQEKIDKAKKAKKSEEQSKAAAAKKQKDAEDQKEQQEVTKARKKNEKNNLESYKNALKSLPSDTKNAITDAYVDDSGQTVATLNDEALAGSDNQLKDIAHLVFNRIQSVIDNNKPFPDDSNATYIRIYDGSGDLIARTSAFGGFKYVYK